MLDLIIEAQNHQILNTFKSVLVHFREGKNQARRLEDTFALPIGASGRRRSSAGSSSSRRTGASRGPPSDMRKGLEARWLTLGGNRERGG